MRTCSTYCNCSENSSSCRRAERPRGSPSIAGKGELRSWLRVTATREGLKRLRGRRPVDGDEVLVARSTGDDPELSYMKEVYRAAFREAFAAAISALEPRERTCSASTS